MDAPSFDAAPYSLLALLAEAAKARRTGTLRVQRGAHIQTAYLREGRVAYASSTLPEEKFEAVLKSIGLVGDAELQQAKEKKEGKESLGRTLMRLGFIGNQDLYKAAVSQTQLIASSLVAQGGETVFEEGRLPDNLADLKIPAEQMLREMANAIPDPEIVSGALGGDAGLLKASEVPPQGVTLTPDEEGLVARLGSPASVGSVSGGSPSVTRQLYYLLLMGFIEPAAAPAESAPATARTLELSAMAPAPRPEPESAATVRIQMPDADDGSSDPTVGNRGKFTTAEVPVRHPPEAPEPAPAVESRRPFTPMENMSLDGAPAPKRPPVPTFGMAEDGGSPFRPVAKKRRGPAPVLLGVIGLAVLGGAYWYLAAGPGRAQFGLPLPWPGASSAPAASAPSAAAPRSAPRPAASAPAPVTPVASVPSAPASAPAPLSAPAPVSAPASAPSATPSQSPDAWTLLARGEWDAAAKLYQAKLQKEGGWTLRSVVLCQPAVSAAPKIAQLPPDSGYMIVPIDFNGRACYRQIHGRYPTEAAARAARDKLPAVLQTDPWAPETVAKSLK